MQSNHEHFPSIFHCFPMTRHRSILRQGKHTENIHFCYQNMLPLRQFAQCIVLLFELHTHTPTHTALAMESCWGTRWQRLWGWERHCLYAWQHFSLAILKFRKGGTRSSEFTAGFLTLTLALAHTQIIIKNIILRI